MASPEKGKLLSVVGTLRTARRPLLAVIALIVVALWFMGAFETDQITPGQIPRPAYLSLPEVQGRVVREERPMYYAAVGTVRARTRATVAAQINGRVTQVEMDAGQAVDKDDLLAKLDSQELEARVAQAASDLEAARAELADAEQHHTRMARLLPQKAITQVQMDQAYARLRRARAQVEAAAKRTEEADIILGYARIRSPMDGVIERREVNPGDMAWPGKPLFVIHKPRGLRLEADVPEGMIRHVEPGRTVEVVLPALGVTMQSTVEEIVPSADPASRTFLVRVSLPATDGVYPGMFGHFKIRLADHPAVLVPEPAVSEVGQLRTVLVLADGNWVRRYVTLGARGDGLVEVLSGLSGGEIIGWSPAAADRSGIPDSSEEAD